MVFDLLCLYLESIFTFVVVCVQYCLSQYENLRIVPRPESNLCRWIYLPLSYQMISKLAINSECWTLTAVSRIIGISWSFSPLFLITFYVLITFSKYIMSSSKNGVHGNIPWLEFVALLSRLHRYNELAVAHNG